MRYISLTHSKIMPYLGICLFAIAGCVSSSDLPKSANEQTPQASQDKTSQAKTPQAPSGRYRQVELISGLENPWSMVWLPDRSILITERPGRLRMVRDGKLDPNPVAGVPPVLASGQGGLLDVSLHPKFADNRFVYLTYAHGTRDANRTRVARGTLDGMTLRDVKVIFEVSQPKSGTQHFGSRMLWLPDGTLLIAIGDGGNPPVELEGDLIRKQAQNLQSHLGKIVRLNDDGSIPQDNPFRQNKDANPAIWSYGHRNIQGLTYDPKLKQVWASEHGAFGGDELNLVRAGKNYGWPVVTFSREYFGPEITTERSRAGMEDAKLVWTPATAPSGLAFYNGDRFPQWQGNLFAGGLVSRDIRRIEFDQEGKLVKQETIAIGKRVRDVRQGLDGLLYVLTDESNGQLLRLEPD